MCSNSSSWVMVCNIHNIAFLKHYNSGCATGYPGSTAAIVTGLITLDIPVDVQCSQSDLAWGVIAECVVWENIQSSLLRNDLPCCSTISVVCICDNSIINPRDTFSEGFVGSHICLKSNSDLKIKISWK